MEIQLEKFLKNNNFYVSTTFLQDGSDILSFLEKFQSYGIQNIELGSNHIFNEKINDQDFKYFKCLVHNHFPPSKNNLIINISSQDEFIRNQSINFIKSSIDFTKKIGGYLYTFHPGFFLDPSETNKNNQNYDFIWSDNNHKIHKNKSIKIFYQSLEEIISYAESKKQLVAIETEGSINKSDLLLFQNIDDFLDFRKYFNSNDIKINLNIGHLNLASKKFNFKWTDFYRLIKDYIVCFELSHNDGLNDDHSFLRKGEWYWDIILDSSNQSIFKVLEYRNLSFPKIIDSFKDIFAEFNAKF